MSIIKNQNTNIQFITNDNREFKLNYFTPEFETIRFILPILLTKIFPDLL